MIDPETSQPTFFPPGKNKKLTLEHVSCPDLYRRPDSAGSAPPEKRSPPPVTVRRFFTGAPVIQPRVEPETSAAAPFIAFTGTHPLHDY